MTNIKFDPFKNLTLDKYESEIEAALPENPKLSKIDAKQLKDLKQAAVEKLAKKKNVNIRIAEHTLISLKSKANKLGLPYQTLISSVLHQYANA